MKKVLRNKIRRLIIKSQHAHMINVCNEQVIHTHTKIKWANTCNCNHKMLINIKILNLAYN